MSVTPTRHSRLRHLPSLEELRRRFADKPRTVELRPRRPTLAELQARREARLAGHPTPVLDLYDHYDRATRDAVRQTRREALKRIAAEIEDDESSVALPTPAAEKPVQDRTSSARPDLDRIRRELGTSGRHREPTHHPLAVAVAEATEGVPLHLRTYKRTPLQINLEAWLDEVKWNLMVTLTFKGDAGVSKPLAEKIFGRFLKELRQILIRKNTDRKIPMAAVVENSREQLRELGLSVDGREGTHIHFLTRVRGGEDPYKYKEAIRKAWIASNKLCGEPNVYCPDSDKWFLPLTSDEMRRGFTGYVLKHHGQDTLGLLTQYLHFD